MAADGASGGNVSGIGVNAIGAAAVAPAAEPICGPIGPSGGVTIGGAVTTGTGAGTGALPGGGSGTAMMVPWSEAAGDVSNGGRARGISGTPDASGAMGIGGRASDVLGASNDPAVLSGAGGVTCAVARLRRAQR